MSFRTSSLALLSVLFAVGCGSSDPIPGDVPDTGKADTGSSGDTSTDTGSEDTGSDDTGSDDTGTTDTGTTETSTTDTGTTDGSTDGTVEETATDGATDAPIDTAISDGATDASDADAGAPTPLLAGTLQLLGVTSDGYAVVSDIATKEVKAVPLAGGTAVSIGTGASKVQVQGKVVLHWSGISSVTNFGTLKVWTAAAGVKTVSTSSMAPHGRNTSVAAASTDGSWIAYTDGGTEGTSSDTADFKIAKSDGTGAKTIFTKHAVWTAGTRCEPYMRFVSTRLVTTHCTPGTTITLDLHSVDPTTGTATSLGTLEKNLAFFTNDNAGTKVSFVDSAKALKVVPVAGGTATTFETDAAVGILSHDGASILWLTNTGALKRSPTASVTATTLVASGVIQLLSFTSPDDKWILYATAQDTSGNYSDVKITSTTTAGSPATAALASTANASIFGDAFTADSSRAMWFAPVNTTTTAGPFNTRAVSGTTVAVHGSDAWIAYALTGSKVVWNDGWVAGSATAAPNGRATIRVADASSSTSTIVAAGADADFVPTAAKDKIVYTLSGPGKTAGLYVAAVP